MSTTDNDSTRPLLERRLSSASDSEGAGRQFRAARREATQNAVLHRDTWQGFGPTNVLLMFAGLVLLSVPVFIVYVEVKSWYVLLRYSDIVCDQRLALWLLLRNVLTWTVPRSPDPNSELTPEELTTLRNRARLGTVFSIIWLGVGCIWMNESLTCVLTNPELFDWVRFVTLFGVGVVAMTTTFPLFVLVAVLTYNSLVSRGWIKSPNAASDDCIDRLEVIPYSAELFEECSASSTPVGKPRPPKDCCCCMEDFGADPEKPIVATPCDHYFHRECLQEWLKLAKTCPLCRLDLDSDAV